MNDPYDMKFPSSVRSENRITGAGSNMFSVKADSVTFTVMIFVYSSRAGEQSPNSFNWLRFYFCLVVTLWMDDCWEVPP